MHHETSVFDGLYIPELLGREDPKCKRTLNNAYRAIRDRVCECVLVHDKRTIYNIILFTSRNARTISMGKCQHKPNRTVRWNICYVWDDVQYFNLDLVSCICSMNISTYRSYNSILHTIYSPFLFDCSFIVVVVVAAMVSVVIHSTIHNSEITSKNVECSFLTRNPYNTLYWNAPERKCPSNSSSFRRNLCKTNVGQSSEQKCKSNKNTNTHVHRWIICLALYAARNNRMIPVYCHRQFWLAHTEKEQHSHFLFGETIEIPFLWIE